MKTYIYLTKRDMKGVELLLSFNNVDRLPATKITDLSILGFDRRVVAKIKEAIGDKKLNHDLWVESCDNTNELRANLRSRGFRKIPIIIQPTMSDVGHPVGLLQRKPTMLRASKRK